MCSQRPSTKMLTPPPNCALGPTRQSGSKRKMSRDALSPPYLHIRSHLPSLCWPRPQCRTWRQESAASEEFLRSPRLSTRSGTSLRRQTWTELRAPPTRGLQCHPTPATYEPRDLSHTPQSRHDRAQMIHLETRFKPCIVTAPLAATAAFRCRKR